MVELLLGRDDLAIDIKDRWGMNPLHLAVRSGCKEVVYLLLKQDDIDISDSNRNGWTPLHIAIAKAFEGTVRLLLERDDIDINISDRKGWAPLYSDCKRLQGDRTITTKARQYRYQRNRQT